MDMDNFSILVLVVLSVPLILWFRHLQRQARRRLLRESPDDPSWADYFENNVPLYRFLPEELRRELYAHVRVFLDEKTFEGTENLEVTDEMRVTVAGNACLLLLGRKPRYFPELVSIVLYPTAFHSKQRRKIGSAELEEDSVRLGESWGLGTVVLAWDHVERGARAYRTGHNVVIHEFAHQLDQEDGAADGAPILECNSCYAPWAKACVKEYERLQKKAKRHLRSTMDHYGATDPAEFFAVATETFFEKGKKFKRKHPELYEQLQNYYHLDPATWF